MGKPNRRSKDFRHGSLRRKAKAQDKENKQFEAETERLLKKYRKKNA